jgi:hypothetical protein
MGNGPRRTGNGCGAGRSPFPGPRDAEFDVLAEIAGIEVIWSEV